SVRKPRGRSERSARNVRKPPLTSLLPFRFPATARTLIRWPWSACPEIPQRAGCGLNFPAEASGWMSIWQDHCLVDFCAERRVTLALCLIKICSFRPRALRVVAPAEGPHPGPLRERSVDRRNDKVDFGAA